MKKISTAIILVLASAFTTGAFAATKPEVLSTSEVGTKQSMLMLEHGFIAPSINIEELDEQAIGLNIVTEATEAPLKTVMSNSFGFGGTNATLVMRKLDV